jgi:hypothetical protein
MGNVARTLSIPENADFKTLYQVTLAEWQALPTLHSGHFDNLKFENAEFRVWVTRLTRADFDDAQAYSNERMCIEQLVNGVWRRLDRYGRLVDKLSAGACELDG